MHKLANHSRHRRENPRLVKPLGRNLPYDKQYDRHNNPA